MAGKVVVFGSFDRRQRQMCIRDSHIFRYPGKQ